MAAGCRLKVIHHLLLVQRRELPQRPPDSTSVTGTLASRTEAFSTSRSLIADNVSFIVVSTAVDSGEETAGAGAAASPCMRCAVGAAERRAEEAAYALKIMCWQHPPSKDAVVDAGGVAALISA